MSELMSCPFCKSQNVELSENDRGDHAVYCKDCRAEGPPALNEGTKKEAVNLWNKRGEKSSLYKIADIEKRLQSVERWIEAEDTRALEASEY